jgi:hypothetical protein
VSSFKRLTDAEAQTLTRAQLLDRVEAEQKYWERKRTRTDADMEAEREFSRIMHAYLSPQAAIQAVRDTLEGRRTDYWEARPGDEPPPPRGDVTLGGGLVMDEGQQAALAYGLREAAKLEAAAREAEAGQ